MLKLGFLNRQAHVGVRYAGMSWIGWLFVACIASAPLPVCAAPAPVPVPNPTSSQTRLAQLSAAEAVRLVERQTGGRVLSVNEEERGGSRVYRLKVLLPEGRIRTVFIDKQTGAQREG